MKARSVAGLSVAAVIAAIGVPHAAAHVPDASLSGRGTPTIDGTMAPGEWDAAGQLHFAASLPPGDGGGTTPATLFVMNDDSNLYIGLKVTRPGEPRGSFVVEFDNDHNGAFFEQGDDAFVANPGGAYADVYRTMLPPCPAGVICGLLDTHDGGTSDGQSAAASSDGAIVYEVSKRLDSTDDTHDFSLALGQTVGFSASIQLWSLVATCNFGSQCVSGTNVPAFGGGDIVVAGADTTPPAITTPGDIGAVATGPNGAFVMYSASAADTVDGPVSVKCSPASGSWFAIGTTTVTCNATDAAGNKAIAGFTVRVKGAAEQLVDVLAVVTSTGPGSSLADKVQDVQTAVEKGNHARACDGLAAFANQVKAQAGKSLTAEDATALVAAAGRIRAVLDC